MNAVLEHAIGRAISLRIDAGEHFRILVQKCSCFINIIVTRLIV